MRPLPRWAFHLLAAACLVTIAAAVRGWIAPWATRLPAGYSEETRFAGEARFRSSPSSDWVKAALAFRRTDEAIAVGPRNVALVASDMVVYTDTGELLFESSGLYGVERHTRAHLAEFGNAERHGQFAFPPAVERGTYTVWDTHFSGPYVATFEREETHDGLKLLVFRFEAPRVDDTNGFSFLPGVPAQYRVHTDGTGWLRVEPASGTVVDYEEQAESYFTHPATGAKLAGFYQRAVRFTPETRRLQQENAGVARTRIVMLERVVPVALLCAAVVWLAASLLLHRRARKAA